MKDMVLLLMTSRSGSSMVAEVFVNHRFTWAKDQSRNPLVGGKKVRYRSFENQTVKDFTRSQFGIPLGDMITFDDHHVRAFDALVQNEYDGMFCMWKGAVEFFPLWWQLHNIGAVNVQPMIIWRPMNAVMDSLRAKRSGRVDEKALVEITTKRYDILTRLASDHAFPVIETDKLVRGDLSSLREAFDAYGYKMDEDVVRRTIRPEKWETDR